jgi:predicted glycosyltransferase involved in capsule biosynthesis
MCVRRRVYGDLSGVFAQFIQKSQLCVRRTTTYYSGREERNNGWGSADLNGLSRIKRFFFETHSFFSTTPALIPDILNHTAPFVTR